MTEENNKKLFENRMAFDDIRDALTSIKGEIGRYIVGQEDMIQLLMAAVIAKGHVLIEGYPGLAKTLSAKLLAGTLDCDFKRIQFTPDLMPSDLVGTSVFNFKSSEFEFHKGPLFTQIIVIDEINRAPAKTQSALFEVMEERQITVEGEEYQMQRPFIIIATQNPVDLEGTYQLPEAQMDRFLFRIIITYPSLEEEAEILRRYQHMHDYHDISDLKSVLGEKEIIDFQKRLLKVHISEELLDFIALLTHRTRSHPDILVGGSPRASLAMMNGAKAIALMEGRDFVSPDDILKVVEPVLNHRLLITAEKEMEGKSAADVIQNLLKSVEVPR